MAHPYSEPQKVIASKEASAAGPRRETDGRSPLRTVLTSIGMRASTAGRSGWLTRETLADRALLVAELAIVVVWALMVTTPYLDLDPQIHAAGREHFSGIQFHHFWTWVRECGMCALWNGSTRGGFPAVGDPLSPATHPLVMVATLGWGVINGTKLALVGAFTIVGVAQWWLGYVLGLSPAARVWTALLAIAGGHLAGRMQLGAFFLVLGTAVCVLVLPPLILLCRTGSRRHAVLLGVMAALAALAGVNYMLLGLALTLLATPFLLRWDRGWLLLLARRFALAVGIAFLLAAPYVVPLLHFLPQFEKDADAAFKASQPFAYVPLNLVINDPAFYNSDVLGKFPYPYLYTSFIGWLPVLLAVVGLIVIGTRAGRREVSFLAATALLAWWVASAAPLSWVVNIASDSWLAQLAAGVRHPPLIAGLAVAPVLALAGFGLDRVLGFDWPRFRLMLSDGSQKLPTVTLDPRWLLLVPLIMPLGDARVFGSAFIRTERFPADIAPVLAALQTPDLQWVSTPYGEHMWTEAAVGAGLKVTLSTGTEMSRWKQHPTPDAVLVASRDANATHLTKQGMVNGVALYAAPPGQEYAAVEHADARTICTAQGRGGHVDVTCNTPADGTLIVRENYWSGWGAEVDGRSVPLEPHRWLAVALPAGEHHISFRYRPWDVYFGLMLGLAGLGLAGYSWRQKDDPAVNPPRTD